MHSPAGGAAPQLLEPGYDQPGEDELAAEESSDERAVRLKAAITATVLRRITEAKTARSASGIEEIWDDDADQYDGIDDLSAADERGRGTSGTRSQAPRSPNQKAKSRLYLNITKPKTKAAVARVSEILVPTDDRPWDLEPTPVPEFAEAMEAQDQTPLTLGDGTQAPAMDVAKVAMDKAAKACAKAKDWIEDQFVEGDVYAEMRKVIRSAGRLGTGVLKGPFPVVREHKKWTVHGNLAKLEMVSKTEPTSKCIDVRDCFPDPACGDDIHQGSYFVERDFVTARGLRALAKDQSFDRAAIVAALKEGPQNRGRERERNRDTAGEPREGEVFELYHYYGDIDPLTLISMGVAAETVDKDDLYLKALPAIVTVLNDRPIKCALNPLETGGFPFDFFPWEPVDGQPWGRGVPREMRPAQKLLVSAVRAMSRNAGLSAGAQVILNSKCVKPAPGQPYALQGDMLWEFTADDKTTDVEKAFKVFSIPSAQVQLQAIIDFARVMADELTNLPMLMQGQQGTAPELLGGMQMLMQNANAPLRVIAKQFDDFVVSRHLRRYYDWCMQMGPEEAKGDFMVQARGATALIAREIAREFMLVRAPTLAQQPTSRIDPEKLEEETIKSFGIPMSSLAYTEEKWKAKQEQMRQNPPPGPPAVEAAKIREQGLNEREKLDLEDREQERNARMLIAKMEMWIQAMELANAEKVDLGRIKAMLGMKAIDSRDKRELFAAERALKLAPENPTNEGI